MRVGSGLVYAGMTMTPTGAPNGVNPALARHPIHRDSILHPRCVRAPSKPVFASPTDSTTAPA